MIEAADKTDRDFTQGYDDKYTTDRNREKRFRAEKHKCRKTVHNGGCTSF